MGGQTEEDVGQLSDGPVLNTLFSFCLYELFTFFLIFKIKL